MTPHDRTDTDQTDRPTAWRTRRRPLLSALVGLAGSYGLSGIASAQSDDSDVFRVLSTTEDAEVSYEFTVAGSVRKTRLGDDGIAADADDLVFDSGETTSVDGSTGDGAGDAYVIRGDLDSFQRTGGDSGLRLVLDGEDVTDQYLDEPQVFRVMSTTEGSEIEYEFTVDGTVEKTQLGEGGTAADDDAVFENDDGTVTVDGSTGDQFGDAFLVTGEILEFERIGGLSGFELYLDGENITDEVYEPG
jgi:hypothetical protein